MRKVPDVVVSTLIKTELKKMDIPKIMDTPTQTPIQTPVKEKKEEKPLEFDDDFDAEFQTEFHDDFKVPEPVKKIEVLPEVKKQPEVQPEIQYNQKDMDGIMGFLGNMKPVAPSKTTNNLKGFDDFFGGSKVEKKESTSFVDNIFNNLNKKKEEPKKEVPTVILEPQAPKQQDTGEFEGFESDTFATEWNSPTKPQNPKIQKVLDSLPDLSYLNANFVVEKSEFFEGFE